MAISQDRILRLIHAGLCYRTAYESLAQYVALGVEHGEAVAWDSLRSAHSLALRAAPAREQVDTLALEAEHFRKNAKRNERERLRAATSRVLAGVAPRPPGETIKVLPRPNPTIFAETPQMPQPIAPELDTPVEIPEGVLYSIEEIEALTAKAAEAYDREQQEKRLALARGQTPGVKLKL